VVYWVLDLYLGGAWFRSQTRTLSMLTLVFHGVHWSLEGTAELAS
jgi:hypothetical protein